MIMVKAPWLYLITWTKVGGWGWLLMSPRFKVLRSGRLTLTTDNALDFCYCPTREHA